MAEVNVPVAASVATAVETVPHTRETGKIYPELPPFRHRPSINIEPLFARSGVEGVKETLDKKVLPEEALQHEAEQRKKFKAEVQKVVDKKAYSNERERRGLLRNVYDAYKDQALSTEEISIFITQFRDLNDNERVIEVYERASGIPEIQQDEVLREYYVVGLNKRAEQLAKEKRDNKELLTRKNTAEVVHYIERAIAVAEHATTEDERPVHTGEMYSSLGKAYRLHSQISREVAKNHLEMAQIALKEAENAQPQGDILNRRIDLAIAEINIKHVNKEADVDLEKSYQAYLAGYKLNYEHYPGVNVVSNLVSIAARIQESGNTKLAQQKYAQAKDLAEKVYLSTEAVGGISSRDYWVLASMLQLAYLTNDAAKISAIMPRLKYYAETTWQVETTIDTFKEMQAALTILIPENQRTNVSRLRNLEVGIAELGSLFQGEVKQNVVHTHPYALTKDESNLEEFYRTQGLTYGVKSEGHEGEVIPGNEFLGGQLHYTAATRYDSHIAEGILEALKLQSTGDIGRDILEVNTKIDGLLRRIYKTDDLENLNGPKHREYDAVILAIQSLFATNISGDSTTNVMEDLRIALGDCRNHAYAKQRIIEIWRRKRINANIATILDTPNDSLIHERALQEIQTLLQIHSAVMDRRIKSPVEMETFINDQGKEMWRIKRNEQGYAIALGHVEDGLVKGVEYALAEDHTHNALILPFTVIANLLDQPTRESLRKKLAETNDTFVVVPNDAFYQHEYKFGFLQRPEDIVGLSTLTSKDALWNIGETQVYDKSTGTVENVHTYTERAGYAGKGIEEKERATRSLAVDSIPRFRGILEVKRLSQEEFLQVIGLTKSSDGHQDSEHNNTLNDFSGPQFTETADEQANFIYGNIIGRMLAEVGQVFGDSEGFTFTIIDKNSREVTLGIGNPNQRQKQRSHFVHKRRSIPKLFVVPEGTHRGIPAASNTKGIVKRILGRNSHLDPRTVTEAILSGLQQRLQARGYNFSQDLREQIRRLGFTN